MSYDEYMDDWLATLRDSRLERRLQDKPLPSEICVQCDIGYHCFGRNASNGCECRVCQTEASIQNRPVLEECPKRSTFEWDHRWLSNDYDFGGEA